MRTRRFILGGMLALPTGDWTFDEPAADLGRPVEADWRLAGAVEHVFTHFALTLEVRVARGAAEGLIWTPVEEARASLPTVFRKALDRGTADHPPP